MLRLGFKRAKFENRKIRIVYGVKIEDRETPIVDCVKENLKDAGIEINNARKQVKRRQDFFRRREQLD